MALNTRGFKIFPRFLSTSQIDELQKAISDFSADQPRHGLRNAEKKIAAIHALAYSEHMINMARDILCPNSSSESNSKPALVRCILFDKTPEKNWLVSWHQDKTIAVNHAREIPGWGPWTIKDNYHHVQPDIHVLNHMITFRLHLDHTDESNGCLRVIPTSHQHGILTQQQISAITGQQIAHNCVAEPGDLLVMSPLLLHASSKATQAMHRRVIHIEYSDCSLPDGLEWA